MNKESPKLMSIAAVFMFAAAVFQIVSDHINIGALFLAAGTCFISAAGLYRKKENDKEEETQEDCED